jgi:hypothetical protein
LVQEESEFREILVKLYHDPRALERKFWIDLGEFSEQYDKRNIMRYIK